MTVIIGALSQEVHTLAALMGGGLRARVSVRVSEGLRMFG